MSASLAPQCNDAKERYDSCFLKWYSEKYLRGHGKQDDCSSLFKEYKSCLSVALKDRGIDKLLEEAREDHKENDALNLRKFEFHSIDDFLRLIVKQELECSIERITWCCENVGQ